MGQSGGFRKVMKTERVSILLGAIVGVAACAQVDVGAHALKASAIGSEETNEERLAPVQVATDAEGYALWSGFRTKEGAWIAHPRLPAPSTAYVRNTLNGRVIQASLLRRDPTTPGPMILLSAEAARDLGIGPHRLTKVQIEVIEDTLPEAEIASAPTAEVPDPAPTALVSEDALPPMESTIEPLAAIVEAPAPLEPPEAAPEPQTLAEIPAESATASAPQTLAEIPAEPAPVAALAAPTAPAQPAPASQSGGVFRGDAPYELGDTQGGGGLSLSEPATPSAPSAIKAAEAPAPTAVEAAPVKVASAPVAAEPAVRTSAAPSAPALAATPTPAAPSAPAPTAASGETQAAQSFVQVVSFTAESSAAELATRLSALGHPSLTDSGPAGESRWHRVLIGPLTSAGDEQGALEAARSLGYNDAFVTRRGATASEPAAAAEPAVAPSAPPPEKPTAEAAPAPASGTSPYIQVGSFSVKSNADALVATLKGQGLPSFATAGSGDSKWSRVLIGPLDGSEQTARALDAAKSLGHTDAFITRF